MVIRTPSLGDDEQEVLTLLAEQRERLRDRVAEPRRWTGTLRRMAFARAVQGSNSIEGYAASLDDVVAAVEGEATLGADEDTQRALSGYRDAMTYVLQIADETLDVDEGLLKSLHFMMLKHDLAKNPGRWRRGPVYVRRGETGEIVHEGAPAGDVSGLVAEMFRDIESDGASALVKAAMAHLNLVMIHPFSDGNGRMARCLQTLVLARDSVLAPVFASIEEFLGQNTEAYYSVLAEVGLGAWDPSRDARPWIRFCLRAHYAQVRTMLRRREEIEELWNACLGAVESKGLAERCASGVMDAAYGLRLRRRSYRTSVEAVAGEEISDLTASRDLKAMVDSGLLAAVGERRSRYYLASDSVTELRTRVRAARSSKVPDDPFVVVHDRRQLSMT